MKLLQLKFAGNKIRDTNHSDISKTKYCIITLINNKFILKLTKHFTDER